MLDFIHLLENNTSLDDDKLDSDTRHRLSHPLKTPPTLTPDEELSIKLFLADTDGSDKIYNEVQKAILERHSDNEILTLHQVYCDSTTIRAAGCRQLPHAQGQRRPL